MSYVEAAGRDVFNHLKKGSNTIVVLESTVYPGVTAQTWLPIIEELSLVIGEDVEIAYCPERFNPGDAAHGVRQVARVIGCSNPEVGEKLVELYSKLTSEDVRYVGKLEVAEAAKVIENVQRDINIALVNELARIFPALDVDVEDVLSAAATKWNFHRYTPGVGVGGHCIPVDPYYMIQRAADVGVPAGLITAARAVNRSMPNHVAGVVTDLMWNANVPAGEAKVLLLGWSYKAEVGDPRETPAEPLTATLLGKNITVGAWDPHIDSSLYPEGVVPVEDILDAEGYDLVILGADKWVQLQDLSFYRDQKHMAECLRRLPKLAVAPRNNIEVPQEILLTVPDEINSVSSSQVRRGKFEWMTKEAYAMGKDRGFWGIN